MDANNNVCDFFFIRVFCGYTIQLQELSDETNSYKDDVLKNHSIDGSKELLLRANKLNVASKENSWDLRYYVIYSSVFL